LILIDRYLYLNKPIPKFTKHDKPNSSLIFEYRNPNYDYSLFGKWVFHIVQLIFVHILIFWILPNRGTYRLTKHYECSLKDIEAGRCNETRNNSFLALFYFLYCFYWTFSALQIRAGWPTGDEGAIKKSTNPITKIWTMLFFAIPFMWELEEIVGWLWTNTSFDIFQWFKFQEVYVNLYIVKCNSKDAKEKGMGTSIPKSTKYGIGGSCLFLLLLLIIAPILLFSTLNPMVTPNNVLKASMVVTLEMNTSFSFELFRSSRARIYSLPDTSYQNLSECDETRTSDYEQLQEISFPSFSDSYIFPTNDTRQMMLEIFERRSQINANISVSYYFTRSVFFLQN